jgi:hypothetical protein
MSSPASHSLALRAELDALRIRSVRYERALRAIAAGSAPTGRWLDTHGHETTADDPEAQWETYTEAENQSWLKAVTRLAKEALAQEGITAMEPSGDADSAVHSPR